MTKESFFQRTTCVLCFMAGVISAQGALAQSNDAPPAQPQPQPAAPPPQQPSPQRPVIKSPAASLRVVDRIVAVVNDEVITSNELQMRLRMAETQLQRQNIALPARPVLTRQVLERMIIDRAQLQL